LATEAVAKRNEAKADAKRDMKKEGFTTSCPPHTSGSKQWSANGKMYTIYCTTCGKELDSGWG
jgi:hypothetical protein